MGGLSILLAWLIGAAVAPGSESQDPLSVQVIVFERGPSRALNGDPAAVVGAVEKLLTGAEDRPRLIVSLERLDGVRSTDAAVEVIYAKARRLEVTGSPVDVRRILVPLSGELAQGYVFFAAPPPEGGAASYSVGNVVRNSRGTADMLALLRKLGHKVN